MANTQSIPTQVADAPDTAFRGPFFEINPDLPPKPVHMTQTNAAAFATPVQHSVHAAAACPPVPANSSVAPLEVHEPAPGQRVEITVTPNQPLTFDFNPLDAQAVRHGDDLTLTFADGGVLVLHHIAQDGNPLPTPLQLPDGTVINPCELLQALPGEQSNTENAKIPNEKIPLENEKIPLEHPLVLGAHPVITPFELPSLGTGLIPLGGLPPEGFFTTVQFPPPGNGGFPPGPPGPPGPPVPFNFIVAIEDSNSGVVPNLVDDPGQTTLTITGNFLTDFVNSGGVHGVDGIPTPTFSNPVSVNTGTATGEFGTLALTSNGTYTYTVDVTAEPPVNTEGSDRISEALNQQFSGAAPYLAPLEDEFVVTVSNGFTTQSELLALYIEGADATKTTTAVGGVGAATVLLTYTDLYDPSHSFSETVTVGAGANTLTTDAPIQPGDPALVSVALVSGSADITSIEVAGGTITVPGETLDATHHALTAIINPEVTTGTTFTVDSAPTLWTDVTTDTAATAAGQYLYAEGNAVTLSVAPGTLADADGTILNLGTVNGAGTGVEQGGLGSDTLVWNPGTATTYYNGTAGAVVSGTATAGDHLNINFFNPALAGGMEAVSITVTPLESTADMAQALVTAIDTDANLTALNGGNPLADYLAGTSTFQFSETPGSLAFGDTQYTEFTTPAIFGNTASESVNLSDGLDTLQVQTPGQNLDFTNGTINAANIEVVDLGNAAAGSGGSSVTLDPNSVLQLTHNETSTITSFSGGANAIWIMGDASDTVNLNGFVSGSNPNPMISGPITSGSQDPIPNVLPAASVTVPAGVEVGGVPVTTAGTSPTQMVGFTEFSGTTAGGNTVHVYVENAIATSGHVNVH